MEVGPVGYDVTLTIVVVKNTTGEGLVQENSFFHEQSFSKMTAIAADYYELIAKLQKVK